MRCRAADKAEPVDGVLDSSQGVGRDTVRRFSTFDAVPSDTPANSATSVMVTRSRLRGGWRPPRGT